MKPRGGACINHLYSQTTMRFGAICNNHARVTCMRATARLWPLIFWSKHNIITEVSYLLRRIFRHGGGTIVKQLQQAIADVLFAVGTFRFSVSDCKTCCEQSKRLYIARCVLTENYITRTNSNWGLRIFNTTLQSLYVIGVNVQNAYVHMHANIINVKIN
jgi:hypothetical protein